jgi:hypothetical protein
MAKDIKQTLKEGTKDLLSDQVLGEIETVFNEAVDEKANLAVTAALAKQDDDHAGKVQQLLEVIDDDHTKKLHRIVEAVSTNHSQKLLMVVNKFNHALQNEAVGFKDSVVGSVSNYLDLYLQKVLPEDMLEEAVTNKRATDLIGELRNILSVDMALAKDSIKTAVVDGKKQINEANTHLAAAMQENEALKQAILQVRSTALLEHLSTDLPEVKKNYVKKVLGDKDEQFIAENFDYTLQLFDKETDQHAEVLREEAAKDVKGNVDSATPELVVENAAAVNDEEETPLFNHYMGELGKY